MISQYLASQIYQVCTFESSIKRNSSIDVFLLDKLLKFLVLP